MHPVLAQELERYRKVLEEQRRREWQIYMTLRTR